MRHMLSITASFLMILSILGCERERKTIIPPGSVPEQYPTKFIVEKVDGVSRLFKQETDPEKDGQKEPFYVNGAATNNFYADVKDWGGNVVRTYSTTETTKLILDQAWSKGLYVNMGLNMKSSKNFDYSDPANSEAIQKQFEDHRMYVRRYRNHPAVFCWSIGNEAEDTDAAGNAIYFKYVQDLAEMIHKEDPNHPTTIAFSNSDSEKKVKVIKQYAPDIDILSVNMYDPSVGNVATNLSAAGWSKPWMITEYGPRGTWNMSASSDPKTLSWGCLEELTSTEKADIYARIWKNDIKAKESKGCVGSFIFLWGYQTHGAVLSWYGLFDKNKYSFGAVDKISECWTGTSIPVEKQAPRIENRSKMKMNGKTSGEGVTVIKNSNNNTAVVTAVSPSGNPLTYRWLINKEDDALPDGSMPDGIEGLISDSSKSEITFKAPSVIGGYRLYVFVTDDINRKVAMACIPFLVKDN